MYTYRLSRFNHLDPADGRPGTATPDLYERIGRAAAAYLEANRHGRSAALETFLVQFADHERPLARECLETAALILDCESGEVSWGRL